MVLLVQIDNQRQERVDKMTKLEKYIQSINDGNIDYDKDIETIAKKLLKKFEEVYNTTSVNLSDCEEDSGFVMMPAFLKGENSQKEWLALLDIGVGDAGELFGIQLLHKKHGWIAQKDWKKVLTEKEQEEFENYKYCPLVDIPRDIHTKYQYNR